MITKTCLLILLVTSGMLINSAHAGDTLEDICKKLTFTLPLPIPNIEIIPGLDFQLKCKFRAKPSYVNDYYSRYDQCSVGLRANFTEITAGALNASQGYIPNFILQDKSELLYIRSQQFNCKEAITAVPAFRPDQFPSTAKIAKKNLSPGDFISFHSTLNFLFSTETITEAINGLVANPYVYATTSGDFLVHIYREPNDKIRVKFIGLHKDTLGLGITLGPAFASTLQIVGVKFVDSQFRKILDLNPIRVETGGGNADLFMVDYVFDLNNPIAIAEYDKLMGRSLLVEGTKASAGLFNPFANNGVKTEKYVMKNMLAIDEIAASEARNQPDPKKRSINRVFRGSNSADFSNTAVKVNLSIFNILQADRSISENKVTLYDQNQEKLYFLYSPWDGDSKLLFSPFVKKSSFNNSVLYSTDEKYKPTKFFAFNGMREIRASKLSKGLFKDVQFFVRKLVPGPVYDLIDWGRWNLSSSTKDGRINTYFRSEISMQADALDKIPYMMPSQIKTSLLNYFKDMPDPSVGPMKSDTQFADGTNLYPYWPDKYALDIEWIAVYISKVLDTNLTAEERYKYFNLAKVRSALFREIGLGFIISLLPGDKAELEKIFSFNMYFRVRGEEQVIKANFGNYMKDKELYQNFLYMQDVIGGTGIDWRLFLDDEQLLVGAKPIDIIHSPKK